jgi:hypothetical protein
MLVLTVTLMFLPMEKRENHIVRCVSQIECVYECRKKLLRTPEAVSAVCSVEKNGQTERTVLAIAGEQDRRRQCEEYGVTGCPGDR